MSITRLASECPLCGKPLTLRSRKSDGEPFMACRGFPRCNFTEAFDLNVGRIEHDINAARWDRDYYADLLRLVAHEATNASDECESCARILEIVGRSASR